MFKQSGSNRKFNRRNLLKIVLAGIIIVPLGRIVALKIKDNPLPPVNEPDLKLSDGWLLDASDIQDLPRREAGNDT